VDRWSEGGGAWGLVGRGKKRVQGSDRGYFT
jgi:hypothetical protein